MESSVDKLEKLRSLVYKQCDDEYGESLKYGNSYDVEKETVDYHIGKRDAYRQVIYAIDELYLGDKQKKEKIVREVKPDYRVNHLYKGVNKVNEIEQVLTKQCIAEKLADKYNELLEIIEDEHFTFTGKRDLENKGELIEEIANDLTVSEEFNKLINEQVSWKK